MCARLPGLQEGSTTTQSKKPKWLRTKRSCDSDRFPRHMPAPGKRPGGRGRGQTLPGRTLDRVLHTKRSLQVTVIEILRFAFGCLRKYETSITIKISLDLELVVPDLPQDALRTRCNLLSTRWKHEILFNTCLYVSVFRSFSVSLAISRFTSISSSSLSLSLFNCSSLSRYQRTHLPNLTTCGG
jgi:hypothetical protein